MKYTILLLLAFTIKASAQNVGIGTTTPNSSAELEIKSANKGFLIPRMTTAGISAIPNPAKGLMVFDSTKNELVVNMGSSTAPAWQNIVAASGWALTGNSGTNPTGNFIGTTDNRALVFKLNNVYAGMLDAAKKNYFIGDEAGIRNTTGFSNVAIGTNALHNATVFSNIVAIGDSALFRYGYPDTVAYGDANIAVGSKALFTNTYAAGNTAIGTQALYSNVDGANNLALGSQTLYYNTSGNTNTAVGYHALLNNIDGSYNIAMGNEAMLQNGNGSFNTAIGINSLRRNTSGHENVAMGELSLAQNTFGYGNTGIGEYALSHTTGSSYNTALGYSAAQTFDLGWNNTILGANCAIYGDGLYNCIAIGQDVTCTGSSQAVIGNSATVSIGGWAGWSNFSDGRFKKNIKENVAGLDFIMQLRPVTYQLDMSGISRALNKSNAKPAANPPAEKAMHEKERMVFTGFIAQEVEAAASKTGFDFSGVDKPSNANDFYRLRYGDFVVPLVKAVQQQQALIQQQQQQIDELIAALQAIKEKIK